MDLSKAKKQLENKTVFIVGLGGLGGFVLECLARSGIGFLRLADGDVFSPSNMNRQLLSTFENLGKSKAEIAAKRVREISKAETTVFQEYVSEENISRLAGNADIIVDCTDNVKSRLVLEKFAAKKGLFVVHGAIDGLFGQVAAIKPSSGGISNIYGGIQNTAGGNQEDDTVNYNSHDNSISVSSNNSSNNNNNSSGKFCNSGNPGADDTSSLHLDNASETFACTPAVVGAIQASEAIKILSGEGDALKNRMLLIDLVSNEFEIVEL